MAALGPAPIAGLVSSPLTSPSVPLPLPHPAKGRAISLPMDLDAHISLLLSSGATCVAAAQRNASHYKAATRAFPRVTPTANQWDYKNIIEKLQVGVGHPSRWWLWKGVFLRSIPSWEGAGQLVSSLGSAQCWSGAGD